MTLEQLQALQYNENNHLLQILFRLVDFSSIPEGEQQYTITEGEGSLHSRLEMHASLAKPSQLAIEDEFAIYKAELIVAEEARLAEISRIAALQARLDAITDPWTIRNRLNLDKPNMAIEFDRIIKENDIATLELFESEWTAHLSEIEIKKANSVIDQLRKNRDAALTASDFTQLADAPLTTEEKAQYRTYRSYLRSLPAIYTGGHQVEPIVLTFEQFTANPVVYPAGI